MLIRNSQDVTAAALGTAAEMEDSRLREIMFALVTHVHSFIREVELTEQEFQAAIAVLNEIGQHTNATHNEAALMCGTLGVSTLVCLLNNGDDGQTETDQSLLGPFWRTDSPPTQNGGSIVRSATPGPELFVQGRLLDPQANPIADARVDVWHASPVGRYENQDPAQADMNLRGRFTTDTQGRFWFRSVKPVGYPIPMDSVVGRLVRAQSRHPYRPAHLHFLAVKPGFKTLISQVFVDDDPYLDSDVQYGVTPALVGHFVQHDEPHPDNSDVTPPWFSLEHEFQMDIGESKLPKPPIE